MHLLPEGSAIHQTKLQRRTLAPLYDETFELDLAAFSAEHRLHFGIYDFDRYSRHDLIGAAVLQLHSPEGTAETLHMLDLVVEKRVSLAVLRCFNLHSSKAQSINIRGLQYIIHCIIIIIIIILRWAK